MKVLVPLGGRGVDGKTVSQSRYFKDKAERTGFWHIRETAAAAAGGASVVF